MSEWYFDKTVYKEMFKHYPTKYQHKNFKSAIGVRLRVPFYIPIADKQKLCVSFNDRDILLLTHQPIEGNGVNDKYLSEFEVIIFNLDVLVDESYIDAAVDLSLAFINQFNERLKVVHNIRNVRLISRQDLDIYIPVRWYKNMSFNLKHIEDIGIVNIHNNHELTEGPPANLLNSKKINNLINFVEINNSSTDRYIKSIYYGNRALDLINKGEYDFGVISIQTSAEMFFVNLISTSLTYDNEDHRRKKIITSGYKNILTAQVQPLFIKHGLVFDILSNNPSNLLLNYWDDIYILRNKIVHEGYRCTEDEAYNAHSVWCKMITRTIKSINESDLKDRLFGNNGFYLK